MKDGTSHLRESSLESPNSTLILTFSISTPTVNPKLDRVKSLLQKLHQEGRSGKDSLRQKRLQYLKRLINSLIGFSASVNSSLGLSPRYLEAQFKVDLEPPKNTKCRVPRPSSASKSPGR